MYSDGQIITKSDYTKAAIWCNKNRTHFIEKVGEDYVVKQVPAPTEQELAEQALVKAKAEREEYVSKIIVEVDGMSFDGDEVSQDRMARSIIALDLGEKVQWVLADNSIAMVSRQQLREALRKAGEAQTAIWADPYLTSTTQS